MKASRILMIGAVLGLVSGLVVSCSTLIPPSSYAAPVAERGEDSDGVERAGSQSPAAMAKAPQKERTGIATGWGREVNSSMDYGSFERSGDKPRGLSLIRYNSAGGAKDMGVSRWNSGEGMQEAAGGLLEWGMTGNFGPLKNYRWRGDRFVIGKENREYQLEIKNLSDARLEVVLSVDGLDVIDGQPASTKKRGYLIGPGRKLVVRGFRTSPEKVATFKFSSVDQSYANLRHGNPRNVGVIGLAVFTEKGREPGKEVRARGEARPFAEAPPVRGR